MKRTTRIVLLCEDEQHSVFASRLFKTMGWTNRQMRVEKASHGKGSAEQFVRERFPFELEAYRRNRARVSCVLAVMMDGDNRGVSGRRQGLDNACRNAGIVPPVREDRVAVFVPTWNIETWLSYLDGEKVTEQFSGDPRLERARDCRHHVPRLKQMCDRGQLAEPAPPSLWSACQEFHDRL